MPDNEIQKIKLNVDVQGKMENLPNAVDQDYWIWGNFSPAPYAISWEGDSLKLELFNIRLRCRSMKFALVHAR